MPQNSDPIGVFVKAVAFAADKHRTQRRKDADASPYINHPIPLANVPRTRVYVCISALE